MQKLKSGKKPLGCIHSMCHVATDICLQVQKFSFGIFGKENQEEPQDIVEAAASEAVLNLLPTKSRNLYDKTYNQFREWCKRKKVQTYTENVMLAYLHEKSNEYKSSTVWAQYSS
ncbi:hypothetical protein NQ317_000686 [Molorchus minor]|uniref:Uncharacterized protein n=1 Tax=Molorchus minor TaxID=1323400 RepID=A0ABQ9JL12_9CUCU|nr:hypothetical protein NQ317_000686 [Molorchus minor]